MKLFTYDLTKNKQWARFTDYYYELDNKIESLNARLSWTNPNWIILNQSHRDKLDNEVKYFTNKELLQYGIIQLVIYTDSSNNQSIRVILRINKLKLHIGIIQEYGKDCFAWFYDNATWPGNIQKYSEITPENKLLIDQWFNAYDILSNNNELNDIEIWFQNDSDVSFSPYLTDSTEHFDTIYLSNNDNEKKESFNLSNGILTIYKNNSHVLTPVALPEGCVIFCDFLEENSIEYQYTKERQTLSSYKIFPMSAAGALYIPSGYEIKDNSYKWLWKYVDKATDQYGSNLLFQLPGPPARFYSHTLVNNVIGLYDTNRFLSHSLTLRGGYPEKNKIKVQIATKNDEMWLSMNTNTICSKFVTNEDEEIFFDEKLSYGESNLENYKIPYYTITIDSMESEESVKPSFDTFLTIV